MESSEEKLSMPGSQSRGSGDDLCFCGTGTGCMRILGLSGFSLLLTH